MNSITTPDGSTSTTPRDGLRGDLDMGILGYSVATLPDFVGREIGVSQWIAVNQSHIDAFAACTGDRQWIHVDVGRAERESPFGGPIAHGYLSLSLLASLAIEVGLVPKDASAALNYGLDKVRFMAPVKAGARVRNRVVLLSAEDRGGGRVLLKTQNTLQIEGEQKPALIAEALSMLVIWAISGSTAMTTSRPEESSSAPADDLAARSADGLLGPNPFVGLRLQDILSTVQQIGAQAIRQPAMLLEQEAGLVRELIAILSGSVELNLPKSDKRFADAAWRDNPFYRMYLQGYVAWSDAISGFVERSTLDTKSKERAKFVVSLFTDALAPTNTLLGNPAALKKAIDSGGGSLLAGLRNMVSDLLDNHGMTSQGDKAAFQVGRNLAVSPGAVVFRNVLLELIQ